MVILLPVKYKTNNDSSYIINEYKIINEKWKELFYKNKPTGYFVSNTGNIKNRDGKLCNLYYDKDGYTRFSLYIPKNDLLFNNKKAIRYPYKTHRAVAELFVKNDNPDLNKIVMHLNDIRDCNIYLNLKWSNPLENMNDKKESGRSRYLKGEEKPDAIFTEKDVREICDLIYNKNIRKTKHIIDILNKSTYNKDYLKSYKHLIANIRKKHCWIYIINEYL